MSLQATSAYIHVRVVEERLMTNSGIVLPVYDRPAHLPDDDRPLEAEVLSVGPSVKIPVKPGDHVIYSKFAGTLIGDGKDDSNAILVVHENDLEAIIEPEEAP